MESRGLRVVVWTALIAILAANAFGQAEKSNQLYDTPVKIISKPKALYPSQEKGTICVQGTVTLRVQFLENGEIGKIAVVSGMPLGLNESSVEAAKKIRFKPAMKDGKAVTVFKQVQYSFSLY